MEKDKSIKKSRIVLELTPQEHAEIKSRATFRYVSMKKWVLDAIAARIKHEKQYE